MIEKLIDSPLFPGGKAKHIRDIPVKKIIKGYNAYKIDTTNIFKKNKLVSIYECQTTSYRFYFPYDLSGESDFYEHFQNFDWYYMPWKWEHEITKQYLREGLKVLEVGCAHGTFLKRITELYDLNEAVGLELNETSPIQNSKWRIVNQFIQDFQKENSNKFDLVCSYQVLEHIPDVYNFIEANVACLKKGGNLIISVPNNDSFINEADMTLNMPPHHLGLWNTDSLTALEKIFPIKIIKFHYESLQDYHIGSYLYSEHYMYSIRIIGKIIRKWHKITGKYAKLENDVLKNKEFILGHTILAVYEKI